jgi:nitroreductase
MDVLDSIRDRRSIRQYRAEGIPEEKLTQVLEAGRWAPSAGNRQPWRFVVVRDDGLRKRLGEIAPFGWFMAEAPVTIAVVIDPQGSNHPVEDGAAATQNMLLAAHALGLGTCWIGSYGSSYEDEAKQILGIPAERRVLSLVSVGYAAESPQKDRMELNVLVSYDRYAEK